MSNIRKYLQDYKINSFNLSEVEVHLIDYIEKLENRISELESQMDLIRDNSDLLQSAEERYYS